MSQTLQLAELKICSQITPAADPVTAAFLTSNWQDRSARYRCRIALHVGIAAPFAALFVGACVATQHDRNGQQVTRRIYEIPVMTGAIEQSQKYSATLYRHAYFFGQERDSAGVIQLYDGVSFENLISMDGDGAPKIVVKREFGPEMSVREEKTAFRVAQMLCDDLGLEPDGAPYYRPLQHKVISDKPTAVWEMGAWGVFNLCH